MGEKTNITKSAGKISVATICSRVLGFIRDVLLAQIFGATGVTDAFFVAYRIPNLLRELFAEGSVSAGYVPVFSEYMEKEGREEARKLAGVVLAFLLSVTLIICFIGILSAPYIVWLITDSEFIIDNQKYLLTIKLMRIMFPFLVFISLAALAMGTLNTLRIFFVPALAPAFFNLVMITFALFIAPRFSIPITAMALAVTFGGAVQYGVQLIPLVREGFNVRPRFVFNHPGLKRITLLVIPVVLAAGALQINVLISNVFATSLDSGSVTYLYYAYRLMLFPISIFGVSMAMALLPSISEQVARGEMDAVKETFSFSIRLVFFTSIPATAGLIALAEPIISTLFQRGEWSYYETKETVYALIFYSSGIWMFAGLRIIRAVYYSMQDTRTPLKVSLVAIVINIVFCYLLIGPFNHGGLAFALVISAAVNFFILFGILRSRLGRIDGRNIVASLLKSVAASIIMGFTGWYIIGGDIWRETGRIFEKSVMLSGVIALCVGIYLLIMYFLKSSELKYIVEMRKGRR